MANPLPKRLLAAVGRTARADPRRTWAKRVALFRKLQGEFEVVMGVEHVEGALDRGRLMDVRLGFDEAERARQRLAEKRMVVDDEKAAHAATISQGKQLRNGRRP